MSTETAILSSETEIRPFLVDMPDEELADPPPHVSLLVAFTVFPGEIFQAPRHWVKRAYHNLIYFREAAKGGHFAAWEEPQLFSEELRAAFGHCADHRPRCHPRPRDRPGMWPFGVPPDPRSGSATCERRSS